MPTTSLKIYSFKIPGRLPCLNEIISKAQYNRFAYGSLKKTTDKLVSKYILASGIPKITKPLRVVIDWIEPNSRRDIDGISAGSKFILDSLVNTERIKDDSRPWIREIVNHFPPPDKENPRILVSLEEIGQ